MNFDHAGSEMPMHRSPIIDWDRHRKLNLPGSRRSEHPVVN